MIEVLDGKVDKETRERFLRDIRSLSYNINVTDAIDDDVSGASAPLEKDSYIFNKLYAIINDNFNDKLKDLQIVDAYVNCFYPNERPAWHVDSDELDAITVLYYANTTEYDEGGTEFLDTSTDEVRSILPVHGRIILFSSYLMHRATSFRDKQRFTVAFKYKK